MVRWKTWLLLSILIHVVTKIDAVEVTINQGKLAGTILQSRNATKFYAFFGIPYAKPPIGELRFQPPQEPDKWNGVRNATILPPSCLQKNVFNKASSEVIGSEDCLYLNIYTPSIQRENNYNNLPVMVYIHGGSFLNGNGKMYQGSYFMDYPMVLINFNYRLGPLGFLSTVDEELPGNYGMKDQVAALKWVQENVAIFGGDPKQVTIFGHSAGGVSVHLHLYSPLSKGLFQRAIAQSGSALTIWAQVAPHVARQRAFAFGLLSGCPTQSSRVLVNCLRKIPAEDIIHTVDKFWVWDFDPLISFGPVIESKSIHNAFLIENPRKQKIINNVPLIIGTTSGEGGIRAARYYSNNGTLVKKVNEQYKRIMPVTLIYGFVLPHEKIDTVTDELKKFYFGNKEIGLETSKEFVDMLTDSLFLFHCVEAALRNKEITYFYYYDHLNKFSLNNLLGNYPGNLGVCHGDDIISFFPVFGFRTSHESDTNVSRRLVNYWVNFATNGNPGESEHLWQPITSNEMNYLHITSKEDKLEKYLLKDKYEFLKNLQLIHSHSAESLPTLKDEL
ncbi:hypothetical protein PGB90_003068 [Kerria lacca]